MCAIATRNICIMFHLYKPDQLLRFWTSHHSFYVNLTLCFRMLQSRELERLSEEVANLQTSLCAAQSALAAAELETIQYKNLAESSNSDLIQLQSTFAASEAQVCGFKSSLAESRSQVTDLLQTVNSLESLVSDLKNSLSGAEVAVDRTQSLEADNAELLEKLELEQLRAQSLTEDLHTAREESSMLHSSHLKSQEKQDQLLKSLESTGQQDQLITELQAKLERGKSKVKELSTRLKQAIDDNVVQATAAQEAIARAEAELAQAIASRDAAEAEVANLRAQLQEEQSSIRPSLIQSIEVKLAEVSDSNAK